MKGKNKRAVVITAISILAVMSVMLIGCGAYAINLMMRVDYDGGGGAGINADEPIDADEPVGTDILDEHRIFEGAASVTDIPVLEDSAAIQNILILGVDARNNAYTNARSDTMMIMTLNHNKKTIKITSLLRDTCVAIPGRDRNGDNRDDLSKLTNAYNFGKFDLLSKTIEQNLRIKITRHIAVNFAAFESCIDAVDGVRVQLTAAEAAHIQVGHAAGEYLLSGAKALEHSRNRKIGDDFARTGRQRAIINALLDKATGMDVIRLTSLLQALLPNVSTSMSSNELIDLASKAHIYREYEVVSNGYFPAHGDFDIKSTSFGEVEEIINPAAAVTKLHKQIVSAQ